MNKQTSVADALLTRTENKNLKNLEKLLPQGKKERVDEILRCGVELLARDGYHDFSVRKVAREAGMSLGNLQQFFKTKEDLLTGVLIQVNLTYDQAIREMFDTPSRTGGSRFDAVMVRLLEDTADTKIVQVFSEIWTLSVRYDFAREIFQLMYNFIIDFLSDLIRDEKQDLSRVEANYRAAQIIALVEGHHLLLNPLMGNLPNTKQRVKRAVKTARAIAFTD